MAYFDFLPNVYVGEGVKQDEAYKYRLVKNIFRRIVPREDLEKYVTFFERIPVDQGLKPSDVANILFDDPFLDWVILLTNNITDIYEQWPKTEDELLRYINTRYSNPDDVHHYETREALYNGVVFVKEGITVNSTWRTVLPDGTTLGENDSIYAVSNYEHETYLNELKRFILVPTPRIIDKFVDEFEELVAYDSHAELDEAGNKKTPLSISSRFTNQAGSAIGSTGNLRTAPTGAVTS